MVNSRGSALPSLVNDPWLPGMEMPGMEILCLKRAVGLPTFVGSLQDVVTKGIFDKQPEMRCAAAEAAAMAIEDNDPEDLIFDLILTAGSNTMAIDKSNVKKDGEEGGSISRKPSVASVVQDLGFGRAPSFARRTSSNASQRSSKWASAFERLKSDPKIDRTQAFFSRLGQAVHMEGSGIFILGWFALIFEILS